MHLQQTKRASRASGGPQYYFHDLTEPVKLYLRQKGAVQEALMTPYGATKSHFFAVSHDRKLGKASKLLPGSVGHDRIQQGVAGESIGEATRRYVSPLWAEQLMNVERHNKGVVSWSLNEICRVVADHRLESKIPHVQEPDLLRASGALAHLREYILRYSKERDCVVDPFGGSGVTAIEALLENRAAIHNDINPLANFIAQGVAGLAEGTLTSYRDALERAKSACLPKLAEMEKATPSELNRLLSALPLPENVQLPATSNVENYRDLFTPRQLAALTILKVEVERIPDQAARNGMRLAWSATLAKLNKTFLSAKGRIASRGGSSIFSIYRYKVAKEPVGLPAWATFEERVQNVIAAKREIEHAIKLKEAGAAIPSGPCTRRKTANRYWPEK